MQIKRNNEIIADVYLLNDAYVVEEIMGEHTLTLNFRLRDPVEFEINDYVEFQGNTYAIRYKERVKKEMKSLGWEYTVKMYASQYELQDVLFFLHGKPERRKNTDSFTGTARQMLDLIVRNMNRELSGWTAGSCIETEMYTFSFKDKNCSAVLSDVVKTFETEYWILGKQINIGKREYASNGLLFGQGPGMGFRDLELAAVEEKPPVTVVYPYGSDKNLTVNDYGYDYLVLPGGKAALEKNVEKYGRFEVSKQFDHIYPKGEFHVKERIDDVTFISDVDFDLLECLIDEVEVIVTFQDGALAGYDLAIKKNESQEYIGWDNATKQITLAVNEQENALTVPGDINFSVGDTFILTGLKMPQKYIDDAEKRLEEAAQKYLDENCEKKVKLNGKCDDIYFKQLNVSVACGQMIGVVSEKLNIDREIRVTRVKRFLENDRDPYRYELTLSDFLDSNGFKDIIDDLNKLPDEIQEKRDEVLGYSKRRWRDAKETQAMLKEVIDGFSDAINPITIETMSILVGSESLQFRFVESLPNLTTKDPVFHINNETGVFTGDKGLLQHMTLGIKEIWSSHAPQTYSFWNIAEDFSAASLPDEAHYFYAVCSKSLGEQTINNVKYKVGTGSYLLTPKAYKMELIEDPNNYYFLLGLLSSRYEGERSFVRLYGFTEILPGQITTDRIVSPDGYQFWDFLNQSFRIGDKEKYLHFDGPTGEMRLKGVINQSPSGKESPLPVFLGDFVANKKYYPGDEVSYNGSTYRCVQEHQATNASWLQNQLYWAIIAKAGAEGPKGDNGESGLSVALIYHVALIGSAVPKTPTVGYLPASSFTDPTTREIWYTVIHWFADEKYDIYQSTGYYDNNRSIIQVQDAKWTNPVKITGTKGDKGDPGATGLDGMIVRVTEWAVGIEYRYDKNENSTENRYWDIVTVSSEDSQKIYECSRTHKSSSSAELSDERFWKPINQQTPIYTPLLLADNAVVNFMQNNQLLIQKAKGEVTAGLSGKGSGNDGIRIWAGSKEPKDGNFRVYENGKMVAVEGEFSGTLQGVTGSFKKLNCINSLEQTVGSITFGEEGDITFQGGLRHQGSTKPFYTSDVWVRGVLGTRSSTAIVVYGSYAYYYPYGLDDENRRVYISLISKPNTAGNTYYQIPLYGTSGGASGCPVDLVIIRVSGTTTYRYELYSQFKGKKVTVFNANDTNSNIYVYSNGYEIKMAGGVVGDWLNVDGFLLPEPTSSLGRGWIPHSFHDSNWA